MDFRKQLNKFQVVVGYAYANSFHSREAYKHSAELSVYVRQDMRGKGIGRSLYLELEKWLIKQNVYMVHACIASPDRQVLSSIMRKKTQAS